MFDIPAAASEVANNESMPLTTAIELSSVIARSDPSRALSVYDASIDSADVYLLQRTYCEAFVDTHEEVVWLRLFQKLAYIYGPSITHPSLRQAILLYCRYLWRESHTFEDIERQRQRARYALRLKLNQPSKVDEGDLFAAFFMASHFLLMRERKEGLKHVSGFFALMQHLLSVSGPNTNSYTLGVFWSLLGITIMEMADNDETSANRVYQSFFAVFGHRNLLNFRELLNILGVPRNRGYGRHITLGWILPLFVKLKALYGFNEAGGGLGTQQVAPTRILMDIKAAYNEFDDDYMYSHVRHCILDSWRNRNHRGCSYIQRLFLYHLSYVILRILLASEHDKAVKFESAQRLFGYLQWIEDTIEGFGRGLTEEKFPIKSRLGPCEEARIQKLRNERKSP
jgi:hypothetical protein